MASDTNALVSLMRDVLSIVHSRTSESGYADASEILAELRKLCDKHGIPVDPDERARAQRIRRAREANDGE